MKYFISLQLNIFFAKLALKMAYFKKKIASSEKIVVIFLAEISGIGFYWYNNYAREISEKSLVRKSVTKSR